MPKILCDYSKGLIYKIVCNDLTITDLYVGSTINFTQRKKSHKCDCIKNKPLKIYQVINENGGWNNWTMLEIEKFPCVDGNELRTRERYWYEELNSKLNILRPITTQQEHKEENKEYMNVWRNDNKEHIKEYSHNHHVNYYEANKEIIIQKVKDHYEANKEDKLIYAKEYRDTHKESVALVKKKWAEEHKEEIKEKQRLAHLRRKAKKD